MELVSFQLYRRLERLSDVFEMGKQEVTKMWAEDYVVLEVLFL